MLGERPLSFDNFGCSLATLLEGTIAFFWGIAIESMVGRGTRPPRFVLDLWVTRFSRVHASPE